MSEGMETVNEVEVKRKEHPETKRLLVEQYPLSQWLWFFYTLMSFGILSKRRKVLRGMAWVEEGKMWVSYTRQPLADRTMSACRLDHK